MITVLGDAIGQEIKDTEIDWWCDNPRCQGLRVDPFSDWLNILSRCDIVFGEFWIYICFDLILACVLGQRCRVRAPDEFVSSIACPELCIAYESIGFFTSAGISINCGDSDRRSRIREITNELNQVRMFPCYN